MAHHTRLRSSISVQRAGESEGEVRLLHGEYQLHGQFWHSAQM